VPADGDGETTIDSLDPPVACAAGPAAHAGTPGILAACLPLSW
jgi:hypothetical protein